MMPLRSKATGRAFTPFAVLLALFLTANVPGATTWNVRDFGALGDGVADDTVAFQKALNKCAETSGGIVSVPSGKYLMKGHLSIPPSVTLEGVWQAPPATEQYHSTKDPASPPLLTGSVLLATEGAGNPEGPPFITVSTNSTLKGLTIFYPEQTRTNPPRSYPWTVQSTGAANCSIIDVLMVNSYQAVDFGSRTAGRHLIRNLYAQALYRGLLVDQCLDVGRLENIHFWPFWTADDKDSPVAAFTLEKGEAFIFGRSDWEYVSNCFAIAYNVGMKFVKGSGNKETGGPGNYLLSQSGADMCRTAILVEEVQPHAGVTFSNSQIFGDVIVENSNAGMVRFTGCGFFGSIHGTAGTALAKLNGRGRTSFSNCHFYCIDPRNKGDVMIMAAGGRLSISDCAFINSRVTATNPIPLVIEPDVISAMVHDNEFYGEARIQNRARGRTIIRDNIEMTDEDPYRSAPAKGTSPVLRESE